jgi:hypothetical protein
VLFRSLRLLPFLPREVEARALRGQILRDQALHAFRQGRATQGHGLGIECPDDARRRSGGSKTVREDADPYPISPSHEMLKRYLGRALASESWLGATE